MAHHILDLPAEIRLKIYDYLLPDTLNWIAANDVIDVFDRADRRNWQINLYKRPEITGLMSTCRTTRTELTMHCFREAKFKMLVTDSMHLWFSAGLHVLHRLCWEQAPLARIQSLTFIMGITANAPQCWITRHIIRRENYGMTGAPMFGAMTNLQRLRIGVLQKLEFSSRRRNGTHDYCYQRLGEILQWLKAGIPEHVEIEWITAEPDNVFVVSVDAVTLRQLGEDEYY